VDNTTNLLRIWQQMASGGKRRREKNKINIRHTSSDCSVHDDKLDPTPK
jgi:hypothetical protein